ncbi:MAG: SLC13 family permease [Candidatus Sumerlaeia bacterium]|nr:SLC13 family permease [Candidatus Sumerlaeia bacterium]
MQPVQSGELHKKIGLILGLVLFALLLCVRFGPDARIHRMAAIAALMAAWWMTEAIPLAATSLLPLVLMPVLKISPPESVAQSYMNDYIFLFIGGFTIALAMERWNLHRRLAIHTLRLVGDRPRRLVLGFMIATGVLSMWISNTATAMMMMPIALSVILLAEEHQKNGARADGGTSPAQFGLVLMLGVAYAASIGGIGTLVGTPPNVIFASRFQKEFPGAPEISFTAWMFLAVPFAVLFLLITWVLLTFVLHPLRGERFIGGREAIARELAGLGPLSRAETGVLIVFITTALLWIFRVSIPIDRFTLPGWSNLLGLADEKTRWVGDGTVAMAAALALFFIPSGRQKGERLVDWKTVEDLPWNVLFLFGGGFALADGLTASGLSDWVGDQCRSFGHMAVATQILAISGVTTALSELASNTATANMVLPILAGVAKSIPMNPLALMLPAAIAASFGFMLPVATPPNAIVFGTGYVPMGAMVRAGLILDLVGMVLLVALVYFVAIPLWQIDPLHLPVEWLAK